MAILINFFDNVILQAISEEIVPKVSFFKDRYFPTGAGDIFKANEVLTEYRSGDRKLAAFVDQKAGDIPIGRRSYEVHSYKPAYIAPSRLLTLDELTKRGFGEALYPGMDETVAVYLAGCFNPDKLTVKDSYTMTEADKDALRMRDIVLLPVVEM